MRLIIVVAMMVTSSVAEQDFEELEWGLANDNIGRFFCSCVPATQCRVATAGIPQFRCFLADGSRGVCCWPRLPSLNPSSLPGLIEQQSRRSPAQRDPDRNVPENDISLEEQLAELERLEQRLLKDGVVSRGGTRHHGSRSRYNPEQQKNARRALLKLQRKAAGYRDERQEDCSAPGPEPDCPASPSFRTADGSCNNPNDPRLGMTGQPLFRLLSSRYENGMSDPRSSQTDGSPLPSARTVSREVTGSDDEVSNRFTLSVMQWGQFVDHDLAGTAVFSLTYGGSIMCCSEEGQPLGAEDLHPQCLPIEVTEDSFFTPLDVTCMSFVRSVPVCGDTIDAQQENEITHFMDGSQIYGSTEEEQLHLREESGGLLREQPGSLLPSGEDPDCASANASTTCFEAGDVRVNEQVSLTLMHTIWLREHNRIAAELATRHADWDDERLFQEARRITIAEYQHIVYNEWLPTLLDLGTLWRNGLLVSNGRTHSTKYREDVNPEVTNVFATATLRFGHTLVADTIGLFSSLGVRTSDLLLRDVFFDPHALYNPETLTQLARGLVMQQVQALDVNFATNLTEHLFQEDDEDFGMDLTALNIQRGRDHGLATYNDARVATGQSRVRSWPRLRRDMSRDAVNALRSVYNTPDDVDLFIGLMAENAGRSVLLGRTLGRLFTDQLIRLRYGDNFFYDLGGSERPWQLTGEQLEQVRQASWARVLCDNVEDIEDIQPLAFRLANSGANAYASCSSDAIPYVDLDAF